MTLYNKERLDNRIKVEIERLPINRETKDGLMKSIMGSLSFYTYLPLDILNRTKNKESYIEKTLDLSIYAILYVASVVCTDKLFDQQLEGKHSSRLIIEYVYFIKEEAVRGLQRTLGDDTNFWTSFNALKFRLFTYSKTTNHEYTGSEKELLTHLLNKSSLIESYITAMKAIIKEEMNWDGVLLALNKFHLGFQLVDDYEDLNEDVQTDQLNYYLYNGSKLFDKGVNHSDNIKILYAEGIIEKGLNKALVFLKEASDEFSMLQMEHSRRFAVILHQQIARMLVEICFLKDKAAIKAELSNRKIHHNTLCASITNSLGFIKARRKNNNSWSDFMTLAGAGTCWITAFVISMLGDFAENMDYLYDSIVWLENLGGKYNERVIVDADSSNFLIRAKTIMNREVLKSDVDQWEKFRHPSGGFSTYIGSDITKVLHVSTNTDVKGWTSEQYCVTAVACWIAKLTNNKYVYREALSFLQKGMRLDGSIPSYWWTEDLYATAFAVMCGLNKMPLEYIISRQTPEGYWTNMEKPSVFYTSLCLKALETIPDMDSRIKERLEKGITWLLRQQNDDGSWDSENILRIPAPEVVDPHIIEKWKKSSFGVNVITDNYERVFTTALAYNTLHFYKDHVA